ncbi:hypothetical protein HDU98_000438 [Podochytrium sp. JEL0797]|nr:hypothetical protein HDU98_000438 [Podochytrium sp. JEL0797]
MLSAEADHLRHRLASLSYTEPFDMASAALVRHLLADLVQTTDSARRFKAEAERARREKAALEDQVAPLRAEIARLTAENNAVHLDLVKANDDKDASQRRAESALRSAAAESADLKFMAAQYAQKLAAEQARGREERDLAEKVLFADVPTNSTNKKSTKKSLGSTPHAILERLQTIDLETGLEPLDTPFSTTFTPPTPIQIDTLALTTAKLESVERVCESLRNQNADLEVEIQGVRGQVTKREMECARLGAQLEVARAQQFMNVQVQGTPVTHLRNEGAPLSPTSTLHTLPLARARIEQLESQILYLQEHIDTLEQERAGVVEENEGFAQGFVDERVFLKQQVREEREKNLDMLKAVKRLEGMVRELGVMKEGIDAMKGGRGGGAKGLSGTGLAGSPGAGSRSPEAKVSPDSKNRHISLDLVNEIEHLNNQVSNLESIVSEKSARIAFLEQEMKSLRAHSPTRVSDLRELETQVQQLQQQVKEKEKQRSGLERDGHNLRRQLEFAIQNSEKADQLGRDYNELVEQHAEIDKELHLVTKEREDLMNVLTKFESQLTEMNETVQQITSDRDNMNSLYQQAHSELQKLRTRHTVNDAFKPPPPPSPSAPTPPLQTPSPTRSPSPTKQQLETAHARIAALETQTRELDEEVEKLQGDLKAMVFRQRESGANAGEAVRQVERERDSIQEELDSKVTLVSVLHDKIGVLEEEARFMQGQVRDKERKVEEVKTSMGVMEMNLKDLTNQLKTTRSQLQESQTVRSGLEGELASVQKQCQDQLSQIETHRNVVSQVDQDRDAFRNEIDLQAERIGELKASLESLQQAHTVSQSALLESHTHLDQMTAQLDAQDRELATLQNQLRVVGVERDRYLAEMNRANEDLRNLSADLAAMTKESQSLNAELTGLARHRDTLQSDLSECEHQIAYLDGLVREKDGDKDHAMNSYLKVVGERDRLDLQLRAASEEVGVLRMEVIMRDKRVTQVQRDVEESGAEVARLKVDLGAYEKQCSNLTKSLATTDRNCRHLETEKQRLLREITSVRDLAQTLDRSRDALQLELSAAKMECDRVSKHLAKSISEQDALMHQLRDHEGRYERLEAVVAAERTRRVVGERDGGVGQAGAGSFGALVAELAEANRRVEEGRGVVEGLEGVVREKEREVKELGLKVRVLQEKVERVGGGGVQDQDTNVASPSETRQDRGESSMNTPQKATERPTVVPSSGTSSQESGVLSKIKSDIENTKNQLRSYEVSFFVLV